MRSCMICGTFQQKIARDQGVFGNLFRKYMVVTGKYKAAWEETGRGRSRRRRGAEMWAGDEESVGKGG